MDVTDKSTRVRQGEELNLKTLHVFLESSIPNTSGQITVEQFPSGYSNLTYLIKMGDKDLVLRRPPFGRKAKSAHDMGREYRILKALHPVFPFCPKPLVYSDDESILGCPFYVMERLKGIILRKELPSGLALTPEQMRSLCENLLDIHYRLHSIDYAGIGLEGFGKPEGYVKRQIEGWTERYKNAWTDDAPTFEEIMNWLRDKIPQKSERTALIHNDYKFDNVVLDPVNPLRIIGVLDWEMATIGDPLMDLGSSLAYWVQADDPDYAQIVRTMPTNLPGALTRKELVERYAEKTGLKLDNFDFYYCFGLFRLAVIAQQIYYRFYHGQTKDPRFQMLVFAVNSLEKSAQNVVQHSNL
jgi:aminoglycoside phosphotransferase (APT) family kinase protein